MEIIIEGFEPEIEVRLRILMKDAARMGSDELMFWSKMLSIKAELSIEGNKIFIRKETEENE